MTALTTFYLSQLLGLHVSSIKNEDLGCIRDLLILNEPENPFLKEPFRPRIVAIKSGSKAEPVYYDFRYFEVFRNKNHFKVVCQKLQRLDEESVESYLPLRESIIDQQIVDLNGRKLVRVNDIRLVSIKGGTFVVAVDVGTEGKLRRLKLEKAAKWACSLFGKQLPSKFILWDDVDTLDASNFNLRLEKPLTKLQTLHPSDLADIIEELGRNSRKNLFSNLDEEHAADVLEEMESKTQIDLIESLPVEKAADVLEKMPADEAADILDLLNDDKAEMLLREMDAESSEEVRELLEYSDRLVGSIMNTDFISFHENETVRQALQIIHESKPEEQTIYALFVVSYNGKLVATISLRDLVVSEPDVMLSDIMKKNPVAVKDTDKLSSLAEIVSKYNLLAMPVVNNNDMLEGMVVIDDILFDLLNEKKTL
ncbi:MAG TPA: CBS domain-containing protein [Bacteroidales bacterium]|nr:CBS domain-containing protein [Bacteroidales bacterium]